MTRKPPALIESVFAACTTVPPPVAFNVTLPAVITLLAPPRKVPKPMPVPARLLIKMSPNMVALPMVLLPIWTFTPWAVVLPVPVINKLPVLVAPTLLPPTTCTP